MEDATEEWGGEEDCYEHDHCCIMVYTNRDLWGV